MLSLRLAKLNHAMLHNDMDQHSVQACLLDLNDDPYREYLDHRSFWDYYKRVARNKQCTLEILDTLIHDNQTNENYARTNNVMPIKGPKVYAICIKRSFRHSWMIIKWTKQKRQS